MPSGRVVTVQPHWNLDKLRVKARGRGKGYVVVTADGEQASGVFPEKCGALDRLERIQAEARHVVRPCLSCGAPFSSEGKHNRMCWACRHGSEELSPQWVGW